MWVAGERDGDVWLFFTQSTNSSCLRPPEGKHPELWAPGGDILATRLSPGTLISAYQASTLYEGASDQRIYTSVSLDGPLGRQWSVPTQLEIPATTPNDSLQRGDIGAQWSPVLFSEHMKPTSPEI